MSISAAPAKSQEEALRLARQEDLPAVAKAEYAVLKRFRPTVGSAVVADATELAQLHTALTLKAVSPSLGEQKYQIIFFHQEQGVRTVWVYDEGEWGFVRRAGPHWTTGTNPDLPKLLEKLLAKHAATVPKQRLVEYDPDWGIKLCLEPGGKRLVAYDGEGRLLWSTELPGQPAAALWIERGEVIVLPERWRFEITSGKNLGRQK